MSYLVTCHNETRSLDKLLGRLEAYSCASDEIVVVDDFSDNPETIKILEHCKDPKGEKFTIVQHALDRNYGAHKNYGNSLCKGDFIFQLDGDELPTIDLIANIKDIIDVNEETELFFVPRINDFIGVTEDHAKKWGWKLTPCEECDGRSIVNWPDYQGRIYKNVPDRITWDRRLHEKIVGHKKFTFMPVSTYFAIYHDKTIETQEKTNVRYNQWFTAEENKGHIIK